MRKILDIKLYLWQCYINAVTDDVLDGPLSIWTQCSWGHRRHVCCVLLCIKHTGLISRC